MRFANRRDAGRRLAAELRSLTDPAAPPPEVVVLGLPRGGVPVAYEVAAALHAPLDILLVRKLGVPAQPELAMGAIGEGDVRVINERVVQEAHVTAVDLAAVERAERAELERRARRFRGERARIDITGRTVLLVDDGIATGSSARAACLAARMLGAARVVLAVPVGPPDIADRMRPAADALLCLHTPAGFFAVGGYYADFAQTTDEEVIELLGSAWNAHR
ncbi:MAG TPA: phosphoribosyltransferase family protein [Jatrophihabitans sp.]|jgi:putative phosphoribosyl transferase